MVGDVQAVGAALDGLEGVFDGLDTLEDDGELGAGTNLVEDVPLKMSGLTDMSRGHLRGLTVLGRVEADALEMVR